VPSGNRPSPGHALILSPIFAARRPGQRRRPADPHDRFCERPARAPRGAAPPRRRIKPHNSFIVLQGRPAASCPPGQPGAASGALVVSSARPPGRLGDCGKGGSGQKLRLAPGLWGPGPGAAVSLVWVWRRRVPAQQRSAGAAARGQGRPQSRQLRAAGSARARPQHTARAPHARGGAQKARVQVLVSAGASPEVQGPAARAGRGTSPAGGGGGAPHAKDVPRSVLQPGGPHVACLHQRCQHLLGEPAAGGGHLRVGGLRAVQRRRWEEAPARVHGRESRGLGAAAGPCPPTPRSAGASPPGRCVPGGTCLGQGRAGAGVRGRLGGGATPECAGGRRQQALPKGP
jgi:hypothetical protein